MQASENQSQQLLEKVNKQEQLQVEFTRRMISTETVFILGAGASIPYGFPSGLDLVSKICEPSGDRRYIQFGIDQATAESFITALRQSDQQSVDAFLEHRGNFMLAGKTAIAVQLIQCENHNALFGQTRDWYTNLFARLDGRFEEFAHNRVSFITFNYDRSLEHYLFTALCNKYGKPSEEVANVLRKIPIVHVHGQLGRLPWQEAGAEGVRGYSVDLLPTNVEIARKGIKVISEDMDDSPEFRRARELMEPAKQIFFLGFGYHDVNMRRLKVPLKDKAVLGTCYKMTETEKTVLMIRHRNPQAHMDERLLLGSTGDKIVDFLRNTQRFLEA
jgi:hypothetical protein